MRVDLFAMATLLACTGCASVLNDTTHQVKVETKSPAGELVAGATCRLSNDYGTFIVKSGEGTQVRRSSKDLDIVCTDPGYPEAKARAISRANGAMWSNILLGGGVGAIIDHNKGTAYTYPTWIQLSFGRALDFDRSWEKEGQPTPGIERNGANAAPAAVGPATSQQDGIATPAAAPPARPATSASAPVASAVKQ